MAPSCLKATGIGIKIPSIFLSLGMDASFPILCVACLTVTRIHSATSDIIPPIKERWKAPHEESAGPPKQNDRGEIASGSANAKSALSARLWFKRRAQKLS
jgi:hypothetical protein